MLWELGTTTLSFGGYSGKSLHCSVCLNAQCPNPTLLNQLYDKEWLQCYYCNRGDLDKVDQPDYRKITIHSRKVGCRVISTSQENNKLLYAQNLILIPNGFQESKMFHQTMFFYPKLYIQNGTLTQAVILSSTSSNFFAPVAACYNNMRPSKSQKYNCRLRFSRPSLTLTDLSGNTCFLQRAQKVTL